MKKLLIALFLITFCTCQIFAQVKDTMVEQLMTKRTLPCIDIYYNTITLIPQLYKEGKTDTINAIIRYANRHCELYTASVAYILLRSIQTHNFQEAINEGLIQGIRHDSLQPASYYEKNIIGFLNAYIQDATRKNDTLQYTGELYNLRVAERGYINFIKEMASSLATRTDLKPVEQFLVGLYSNPASARFSDLKTNSYNGTLLQKAYNKTEGDDGLEYSLFASSWKPFGKLAILGDHPSVGCFLGNRQDKFFGGMSFSVAFNKSPTIFQVKKNDSIFQTDRFVQYYIGYDIGQALYSTKRTEFTLNGGLGYDGINVLTKNGDKYPSRTLGSFNWNLGAGFKVFLRHHEHDGHISHTYIGLQAKYNFVNYNNRGGTDLTGRSAIFSIMFGGFTLDRPVHYERTRRFGGRCWG